MDYASNAITENTRASYPIEHIGAAPRLECCLPAPLRGVAGGLRPLCSPLTSLRHAPHLPPACRQRQDPLRGQPPQGAALLAAPCRRLLRRLLRLGAQQLRGAAAAALPTCRPRFLFPPLHLAVDRTL